MSSLRRYMEHARPSGATATEPAFPMREGGPVADKRAYEQVTCPRGSGRVHVFATPFSVITTFAVAEPS